MAQVEKDIRVKFLHSFFQFSDAFACCDKYCYFKVCELNFGQVNILFKQLDNQGSIGSGVIGH